MRFNRQPWLSLALLFVTNMAFGWLLPGINSYLTWIISIFLVLLITFALTSPLKKLSNCLTGLLQSDFKAFLTVIISAFATVVIMRWIVLSTRIVILVAAATLAKLELQIAGYNENKAFWLMAIVSVVGLILGILSHLVFLNGSFSANFSS